MIQQDNTNVLLAELGSRGILELTRKEEGRQYFLLPKRTLKEITRNGEWLSGRIENENITSSQILGTGIAKMLVDRIKGITPEELADYFPVITHAMFLQAPELMKEFGFNEKEVYEDWM